MGGLDDGIDSLVDKSNVWQKGVVEELELAGCLDPGSITILAGCRSFLIG